MSIFLAGSQAKKAVNKTKSREFFQQKLTMT